MTALEERRIKVLLKNAVGEVLEERRDLLRDAVQDDMADMAIRETLEVPRIVEVPCWRRLMPGERTQGRSLRDQNCFHGIFDGIQFPSCQARPGNKWGNHGRVANQVAAIESVARIIRKGL